MDLQLEKILPDVDDHEESENFTEAEEERFPQVNTQDVGEPGSSESISQEMEEKHQLVEELRYRLALESAVSELTGKLLSAELSELKDVFGILGRAIHVDRISIIGLKEETTDFHLNHRWVSPEFNEESMDENWIHLMPADDARWWLEKFQSGQSLVIDNVAELPQEMQSQKKMMEQINAKAVLIFPVVIDGDFTACLIVGDFQKPRKWSAADQQLIRSCAVAIAAFLKRKKTEEVLREKETKLRSLVDNIPVGVYRTTPGGEIQLANKALLKMLNCSSFEELKRRDLEIEGFSNQFSRRRFKRVLEAEGTINNYENVWLRADSEKVFIRESAKVVKDEHGEILCYEGIVEDITRQKRDQMEIDRHNQELTFLNKLLTGCSGSASTAELYNSVLDLVFEYFSYDGGCFHLFEEHSGATKLVHHQGLTKPILDRVQELLGDDGKTKQRLLRGDSIYQERLPELATEEKEDSGQRFVAGLPILSGNTTIGVFILVSSIPQTFSDSEKALSTMIGQQIGLAIRRLRTKANLRQSEERMRIITDNMFDMVCISSLDTSMEYVSPSHKPITGYSPEDLKGVLAIELVHPDDQGHVAQLMAEHIQSLEPARFEYRFRTKNGDYLWVESMGKFLLDDDGNPEAILLSTRDISQRRNTEEQLRRREERYRILAENVSDVIWTMDWNGECTFISPSIEKLRGYTVEEAMKLSLEEMYTSESLRIVQEAMELHLPKLLSYTEDYNPEKAPTLVLELEEKCKDGSTIWTEVEHTLIPAEGDRPAQILGVTRNITERKTTERALKESEARYRRLSENALDLIWRTDSHGQVEYVNNAIENVLHFTRKESIGSTLEKYMSPDSIKNLKNWIEEANAFTPPLDHIKGECKYVDKYGKEVPMEINAALIRNEEDNIVAIEGISRDIRERIHAEREQKKLEVQLRQSQKLEAIGTLAGGIAHDFNNMLVPILGYTELAIYSLGEEHPLYENMKEVLDAGQHAKELISQILTFSRQKDGERKRIKLDLVCRESLKLLRSTLPTTIDIESFIDSETFSVEADPTQMHQVLMNLCVNAGHAMPDGGTLMVSLKTIFSPEDSDCKSDLPMDPPFVCLTVADTGSGIDAETQAHIFEPYFTTKEVGQGSGLGLSMVHGIVQQHGGQIVVKSEKGKGCAFHVLFPAHQEDIDQAETTNVIDGLVDGSESILIVDDEQSVAKMVSKMLGRAGYQVTAITSSLKALQHFQKNPYKYDLILTDQTMPDMAGDKLAREILAIRSDIPIVLASGFSKKITPEKSLEMGFKAYINKPYSGSDLTQVIRSILESRHEE